MSILPAGAAHAEVMAAVHGAAFPDDPWDNRSFTTLLSQQGVFGLLDPRGGVALLRVAAGEAEILTIGAAKPRLGIGLALMQAALNQARNAGATEMFLEVAARNEAARGLYRKLGFIEAGRRRAYYANGEDALVLRLAL